MSSARCIWGATLIVLGDREAALTELRLAVADAGSLLLAPESARLDPLWSRLKDDSRFEEYLKSAKQL